MLGSINKEIGLSWRYNVTMKVCSILAVMSLAFVTGQANSSELSYKFNSPAFNGAGYSSHVLTIENLTFLRKEDIQSDKKSALRELQREADNTNLNKFFRNFESRVYAELSKQLSERLFGETASENGTIEILGNTIEYMSDGTSITLAVTDSEGNLTSLLIPLAGFGF
jgi:hypothetical protein